MIDVRYRFIALSLKSSPATLTGQTLCRIVEELRQAPLIDTVDKATSTRMTFLSPHLTALNSNLH